MCDLHDHAADLAAAARRRVGARHAHRARPSSPTSAADRAAPRPPTPARDRAAASATLLADRAWLPDDYLESAPESGMGGGIGQWLLYRVGRPVAVPVQPRRPGRLDDADPRPPRVGPDRPLPRRPGRGDLPARRRRDRDLVRRPAARARRLLQAAAARQRRPPRAHDVGRDVGLDPPARERHRLHRRATPTTSRRARRGRSGPATSTRSARTARWSPRRTARADVHGARGPAVTAGYHVAPCPEPASSSWTPSAPASCRTPPSSATPDRRRSRTSPRRSAGWSCRTCRSSASAT